MSKDEPNIDKRYQDIINYLIKNSWRKKDLVTLTAEKSNVSQRTVHNRLQDLEDRGLIETVRISRNRVFVEQNTENKFTFDFETENTSRVQSLLEETNQLTEFVVQNTFTFRSKHDPTSNSNLLPNLDSIVSKFKNNTLPPKELKELEENIKDLNKISRERLVVIHNDSYLNYIFNIFDGIIFLLRNYDEIDNANAKDDPGFLTLTTDLTETSQMYISFLNEMSLNAELSGYGGRYESRLSERICELQPIIKTGPDFIKQKIYYLIHTYGNSLQRINAFVSKLKNQDEENYNEFLTDVRSLYTEEEREKLRARLRTIADDLHGQQRTIVERLCVDLKHYDNHTRVNNRMKYYNRTKKKIIATLSHGPEKLEDIKRLTTESKPNISSNIDSLYDDGYINNIEGRQGYYGLDKEILESFEENREKIPEADRKEVEKTLERMANWRENHVYSKGIPVYDENKLLQRHQQPPWLKLHSFTLDHSFILKGEGEISSFFAILDNDIEIIQKTNKYPLSAPEEILVIFQIAELLHRQWHRGLENISYHSELSKRLDELKKAHNCASPNNRKHIRSLIAVLDLDEADKLFKQAIVDNEENISDLKESINDIYYNNNRMHSIVEFLSPADRGAERDEVRKELLEYCVNIPYFS